METEERRGKPIECREVEFQEEEAGGLAG